MKDITVTMINMERDSEGLPSCRAGAQEHQSPHSSHTTGDLADCCLQEDLLTTPDSEGKVDSMDTVTALQIVSPTSTVLTGTRLALYLFGQECLQLRLRSASAQH